MAYLPAEEGQSLLRFLHRVLIVAGVVLLLLLLWYSVYVLLIAFFGVLLAILVREPTNWLTTHTRLSDGMALALVLIVLFVFLVGAGLATAPRFAQQIEQLQEQLPQSVVEIREWLNRYPWGSVLLDYVPTAQDLQGRGEQLFWQLSGMAFTTVQAFFSVLVLLFVALYLALDPTLYTNGLLRLVPLALRPRGAEVLGAVGHTLRWWLLGTLLRMAVVGVLTYLGLWLLGMPMALVLALLAALLDFVPYFGPILAAIPGVLLGFVAGPSQGLYVLLVYVVVQQLEGLVLAPVIYHRTVYLPPVLTVLAQVLLYSLAGALGGLLATPIMAVVLTLVKLLYVEQTLGDAVVPSDEVPPEEIPPLPKKQEEDDESES